MTKSNAQKTLTDMESKKNEASSKNKVNINERKRTPSQELVDLGENIVQEINKGQNPKIELSVRGLSNVVYDKKSKTLGLGDKTAQRFFFNVAHTKKFLQTVEVASICKNLLEAQKHASLRDVFYMAKRTKIGR